MFRENTPYIPYTLLYKIMHRLHHCILYLSSSLLATFYTLSFHQLTLLTLLTLLTYINLLNLQYLYICMYIVRVCIYACILYVCIYIIYACVLYVCVF
jgi:hypothetical protein